MIKPYILLTITSLSLIGCSNQQAAQMGLRSSSVNVYAQQMSNSQLCETLYYQRPTSQTKVSIGAEFNRRGLNKKWCDVEQKKWYYKKWLSSLAPKSKPKPSQPHPSTKPAT